MSSKRARISVGVLAVALVSSGGLWLKAHASAKVVYVEPGRIGERIVARAVVVPVDGVAEVRALADGRVVSVSVREGETVKAGTELARIEPDLAISEVERRRAELASLRGAARSVAQGARPEERRVVRAELAAAEEQLALAESRARRERSLIEKGAGTASDGEELDRAVVIARARVDAAKARLGLSEAGGRPSEIRSANARVAAARAAVEQARHELDKTRLIAPIDGVVLRRRIDPGDVVTGTGAGTGAPAFELADTSRLELRMEVEEVDSSRLAPGLSVKLVLAGGEQSIGTGTVRRVGAQLERRTIGAHDARERAEGWVRAAWIEPRFDDEHELPLGHRVEVIVGLPARQVPARVSRSALSIREGRAWVGVGWALGFRETPVELGAADDSFVEVRGVAPGARVRAQR